VLHCSPDLVKRELATRSWLSIEEGPRSLDIDRKRPISSFRFLWS
jgi:hypothetical protein